jgi:hypothetical protein
MCFYVCSRRLRVNGAGSFVHGLCLLHPAGPTLRYHLQTGECEQRARRGLTDLVSWVARVGHQNSNKNQGLNLHLFPGTSWFTGSSSIVRVTKCRLRWTGHADRRNFFVSCNDAVSSSDCTVQRRLIKWLTK